LIGQRLLVFQRTVQNPKEFDPLENDFVLYSIDAYVPVCCHRQSFTGIVGDVFRRCGVEEETGVSDQGTWHEKGHSLQATTEKPRA
jgi:hypothetical protein